MKILCTWSVIAVHINTDICTTPYFIEIYCCYGANPSTFVTPWLHKTKNPLELLCVKKHNGFIPHEAHKVSYLNVYNNSCPSSIITKHDIFAESLSADINLKIEQMSWSYLIGLLFHMVVYLNYCLLSYNNLNFIFLNHFVKEM